MTGNDSTPPTCGGKAKDDAAVKGNGAVAKHGAHPGDGIAQRKIELLEFVARKLLFSGSAPMILTPRDGEAHRPDGAVRAR